MHAFLQFYPQKNGGFVCALSSAILTLGVVLAAPAAHAGLAGAAGGGAGAGAAPGAGGGGAGAGGAGAGPGGGGSGGTAHRPNGQTEVAICPRGMVLNTKDRRCLAKHSGLRLAPELTE